MNEYLDNLPSDCEYVPPERIVSAANKYGDVILVGVRHGSEDMYSLWDNVLEHDGAFFDNYGREEQGFITSKYRFVTRTEAWKIAVEQKQIVRRVGGDDSDGGTLYSENLY
jgi:hypothetical protein